MWLRIDNVFDTMWGFGVKHNIRWIAWIAYKIGRYTTRKADKA